MTPAIQPLIGRADPVEAPQPLSGLTALEQRVAEDLNFLGLPAKSWIPERRADGQLVLDVIIVGAGLCGLAAAAALKFLGVSRVKLFDSAPAGQEGPWITFARMRTLRTRKDATGPALGVASLTFRAWFEAQFGRAAWTAMDRIPRQQWMEYLIWYRRVLDLPVENNTRVERVVPRADGLIEVVTSKSGHSVTQLARRVILATGLGGLGGPVLPTFARGLDSRFVAHAADNINFAALKAKRVGVLGAGATAMDNAATALEAGAARLDMFVRRPEIPRIDRFTGIAHPGTVHGFPALPPALKWRFHYQGLKTQIPPPRPSTLRVARFPNAHLHLSSPILKAEIADDTLIVTTPKGRYTLDFLILGTGYKIDLASRSELAAIAPFIRTWGDVYRPPEGEASAELAASPDLGPHFELREKQSGTCPALSHISCFAYPSVLSLGKLTSGVPSVSIGAMRLAQGLVETIFVEDQGLHLAAFEDFNTPELQGDEWPESQE